MSVLAKRVETQVHAKRPLLRDLGGDELLARLLDEIANDASQRSPVPSDYSEVRDPGSVKAQRCLLRLMESKQ